MESCGKCVKESDIATLISENKTMEKQFDIMQADIKELRKIYDTIYEMMASVSVLTSQMMEVKNDVSIMKSDIQDVKKVSSNMETLNDIKKDVETLKTQPIKDYQHYKRVIGGVIITAIVSGILGSILTMVMR